MGTVDDDISTTRPIVIRRVRAALCGHVYWFLWFIIVIILIITVNLSSYWLSSSWLSSLWLSSCWLSSFWLSSWWSQKPEASPDATMSEDLSPEIMTGSLFWTSLIIVATTIAINIVTMVSLPIPSRFSQGALEYKFGGTRDDRGEVPAQSDFTLMMQWWQWS